MTDKICNNCGKRVASNVKYCPKCQSQSFRDIGEVVVADNNLVHKAFYWPYAEGNVLSKSKLASISVFLFFMLFWISTRANLIFILISILIAGIVFLLGYAIHQIKPKKSVNKIKYNDYGLKTDLIHLLFYWQNRQGNFIVSKTKLISFLVFLLFTLFGFTLFKDSVIFISIIFGIIFEIPVFIVGFAIHKLTNHNDSKPKLPKNEPVKVKTVEKVIEKKTPGVIPEFVQYKNEINQLDNEFKTKEKHVSELIEKRFTPPQLTYTKFMGVVDKSKELFNHQYDSALTMINLASEYSPKIEDEIKSKINILNTIIDKLDDLANELVLTMESSNDDEVNELFDNINDLIHSVKDYE